MNGIRILLEWYCYDPDTREVDEGSASVNWPSVPRVGDHVTPESRRENTYTVHSVYWKPDGSAIVRLR